MWKVWRLVGVLVMVLEFWVVFQRWLGIGTYIPQYTGWLPGILVMASSKPLSWVVQLPYSFVHGDILDRVLRWCFRLVETHAGSLTYLAPEKWKIGRLLSLLGMNGLFSGAIYAKLPGSMFFVCAYNWGFAESSLNYYSLKKRLK